MRKPSVPCRICTYDTNVYGYNYGVCDDCTKAILEDAVRSVQGIDPKNARAVVRNIYKKPEGV